MFTDNIFPLCVSIFTVVGLVAFIAGITAAAISYLTWKSSSVGADEIVRICRADDLFSYCAAAMLFCGIGWTLLHLTHFILT